MPKLHTLITNHADAWGVTLMITVFCLILHESFTPHTFILAAVIAFCYWLGFAVNDYFDAPNDALEPEKGRRNFFVLHPLTHAQFMTAFVLLSLIPLGMFASYGWRGVMIFAAAFCILWAYSAPPLRLKQRPGLDLLTHTLFVQTFPYVVVLLMLDLPWTRLDWAILSFFVLGSLSAQLEQQARDYEVDRLTERNFTTVFGLRTTFVLLRIISALLIINVAVHLIFGWIPAVLIPFGVIGLPLVAHRFIRGQDQPRSETLARVSLAAGLLYTSGVIGYAVFLGITL